MFPSLARPSASLGSFAGSNLLNVWREWNGEGGSRLVFGSGYRTAQVLNGTVGAKRWRESGMQSGKCACRSLDSAQVPDRARGLQHTPTSAMSSSLPGDGFLRMPSPGHREEFSFL